MTKESKKSSSPARRGPLLFVLALGWAFACSTPAEVRRTTGSEPVVGGPCEGCEQVFAGLPEVLDSVARIAPKDEPGEPLHIRGQVLELDGTPAAGTIVYAYQTNAAGIYPRNPASRHGKLRGWARADAEGHYRFDTIRPAGYPDSDLPEHVHMHVIEPGRCTYYIDDLMFTDDPRLTPENLAQLSSGRGGPGVVTPERDADGALWVQRDIRLGLGIADHPR